MLEETFNPATPIGDIERQKESRFMTMLAESGGKVPDSLEA